MLFGIVNASDTACFTLKLQVESHIEKNLKYLIEVKYVFIFVV